jgi:hypothetical protein
MSLAGVPCFQGVGLWAGISTVLQCVPSEEEKRVLQVSGKQGRARCTSLASRAEHVVQSLVDFPCALFNPS